MVSVEDNPPSLVVIVRRCLNTRFRPKRAKNAPCKKSNYVQHLLTAWVVLDQHCWFNSDYLNSFWEEAITILLKRPDISVCLNTFAFAFAPNRFAFARIRNQILRAAVSGHLPPTSQSFDWKNQWVRVQQRLVCPKMHFPHWNIYGSSFVKIIVAIDVKYHLWPQLSILRFFQGQIICVEDKLGANRQ